jgi:hypothetical protein
MTLTALASADSKIETTFSSEQDFFLKRDL